MALSAGEEKRELKVVGKGKYREGKGWIQEDWSGEGRGNSRTRETGRWKRAAREVVERNCRRSSQKLTREPSLEVASTTIAPKKLDKQPQICYVVYSWKNTFFLWSWILTYDLNLRQVLSSSWDGRPLGHNRHGLKSRGLLCFFGGTGEGRKMKQQQGTNTNVE